MLDRCKVLIDGSNLFRAINHTMEGPYRLDYTKLKNFIAESVAPVPVTSMVYYDSLLNDEEHQNSKKFHDMLSAIGFEVRKHHAIAKTSSCPECGAEIRYTHLGGLDVALALEAFKTAATGSCSTIVLVTGDRSYIDLVKLLRDAGVLVIVIFPSNASKAITSLADRYVELTSEHLEDIRHIQQHSHTYAEEHDLV